jgi:aspartate 1-decarboxylase
MRVMLKSKIHRAHVTGANIDYEGSITIDQKLMEAADILPYEQVEVLNINNGARFITYAIEGERGSGEICLNGPAARLAVRGDVVIILSYHHVDEDEAHHFTPKLVHVDAKNAITEIKQADEAISFRGEKCV